MYMSTGCNPAFEINLSSNYSLVSIKPYNSLTTDRDQVYFYKLTTEFMHHNYMETRLNDPEQIPTHSHAL